MIKIKKVAHVICMALKDNPFQKALINLNYLKLNSGRLT